MAITFELLQKRTKYEVCTDYQKSWKASWEHDGPSMAPKAGNSCPKTINSNEKYNALNTLNYARRACGLDLARLESRYLYEEQLQATANSKVNNQCSGYSHTCLETRSSGKDLSESKSVADLVKLALTTQFDETSSLNYYARHILLDEYLEPVMFASAHNENSKETVQLLNFNANTQRPAQKIPFVAWPPPGYVHSKFLGVASFMSQGIGSTTLISYTVDDDPTVKRADVESCRKFGMDVNCFTGDWMDQENAIGHTYHINVSDPYGKSYLYSFTPVDCDKYKPDRTPVITPFVTAYETMARTPEITSKETPFNTAAKTPFTTAFETAAMTPFSTAFATAGETPFTTAAVTAFKTPYLTEKETPFNTNHQTPHITPGVTMFETPFLTQKEAPYETPYLTEKETAFETAYETPFTTPDITVITPVPTQTEVVTPSIEKENERNEGNDDPADSQGGSNAKNAVAIAVPIVAVLIIAGVVAVIIIMKKRGNSHQDDDSMQSDSVDYNV